MLGAFVLAVSGAAATGAAEPWTDATGLAFVSQDAFCAFHCRATHAALAYRHLALESECTVANCGEDGVVGNVPGQRRQLLSFSQAESGSNGVVHAPSAEDDIAQVNVETVDLVSCAASGASISLTVGDSSTNVFAGFYDAFFEAYDAMIAGVNASYDACELALLESSFLLNYTDVTDSQDSDASDEEDETIQAMLVKLNSSLSELSCMQDIRSIWTNEDESLTPFLTRSDQDNANATVLLLHVTTAVAESILALECVASVTELPSILKLTPFARSSVALSRNASAQEGPSLDVRLLKGSSSSYASALTRLQTQIKSATGITNALTSRNKEGCVLVLTSLSEFETWAQIVAILIDDSAVEWVDLHTTVTVSSLARGANTLEQRLLHAEDADARSAFRRQSQRRLDPYVHDLVGVANMVDYNITGSGVIVGVTDTGLYMYHDQFEQKTTDIYDSVDTSARKVVLYKAFANEYDESETVTCGHGTHVSGILAGSSYSQTNEDLGIAPSARIAFMDIGQQASSCAGQNGCSVSLETPGEVADLMDDQVAAGAQIFSFSWGTGGNDYNTQSRDLDNYIYNNPEVLIIVAAGNSGEDGSSTISSPSGAKNVISVGASLNDEAAFASSPCPSVLNSQTVASFSSIGPALDGRLKPDLVAPGMPVISSQSNAPGSTTVSSATCSLQGTSQATPVVAGLAVLIFEWLRDGWWKNGVKDVENYGMSYVPAALLKALIIHSSESMSKRLVAPSSGVTSCVALEAAALTLGSYPDFNQGYGKPTMNNIASFANSTNSSDVSIYFYPNSSSSDASPIVAEGENVSYAFVLTSNANLRVTLVWTDPAGSVGGSVALQNDLDLTVTVPNTTTVFYPLTGNSTTRDSKNNVEMVEIEYDDLVASIEAQGLSIEDNYAQGITVYATVHGYSVKAGNLTGQAFALVASSSPTTVSTSTSSSTSTDFWQPWMTIGVVMAGTVCVLLSITVAWYVHQRRVNAQTDKNAALDATLSYPAFREARRQQNQQQLGPPPARLMNRHQHQHHQPLRPIGGMV